MKTKHTQDLLAAVLKANNTKNLFTLRAVIEAGTGLALAALPSLLATLVFSRSSCMRA